ncbi:MAG: hypothetical protein KKG69_01535 [Alphaproteobacteria bacterium]|nr:hypothetical protein [Alphaproteobacteria bacterium]MBU2229941.1 hypothetical protein [Alphaproteobacteria bacterium]
MTTLASKGYGRPESGILGAFWRKLRGADLPAAEPREMDRALIAAQGKALTMLATMLQARGLMEVEEFADTLGVFAVVVAEDNVLEGDILAVWSGILKESL